MKYRPIPAFMLLRRLVRSISIHGFRRTISDSCKLIFRSLHKHGFMGAIKLFFRRDPASPENAMPQKIHPFDLLHGTDTGGQIPGAYISAISLSSIYTTGYIGTAPSAFTQALSALPIQYEDFTFVDIGCGKGRALLLAAQFPFRHLLGVELSSEMCNTARANVAIAPDCVARISIVNLDATSVTYPDGPLLLFLSNPFLAPVLRRVLRNLEHQLRRSSRPAYLLYEGNPRYTRVLDSFAFLTELSDTAYLFSAEDATFDPAGRTEESFTLYSANITR